MRVFLLLVTVLSCITIGVSQIGRQSNLVEIGPDAVWAHDPPGSVIERMGDQCPRMTNPNYLQCRAAIMRRAGASSQAVDVFIALDGDGWITSFKELGKVDLAKAVYPFMANSNERYLLLNGTPQILDVEDSLTWNDRDLRNDPLYPSFRRRYPELTLGGGPEFQNTSRLADGGQRFVFRFGLVNGCRACWANGYAYAAFDFDRTGRFQGARLLRLSNATRRR